MTTKSTHVISKTAAPSESLTHHADGCKTHTVHDRRGRPSEQEIEKAYLERQFQARRRRQQFDGVKRCPIMPVLDALFKKHAAAILGLDGSALEKLEAERLRINLELSKAENNPGVARENWRMTTLSGKMPIRSLNDTIQLAGDRGTILRAQLAAAGLAAQPAERRVQGRRIEVLRREVEELEKSERFEWLGDEKSFSPSSRLASLDAYYENVDRAHRQGAPA